MISAAQLTPQAGSFAAQLEKKSTPARPATWWQRVRDRWRGAGAESAKPAEPKHHIAQQLTLSSVALGVATTSALFFPPAQVVCLPLLLSIGLTPAQAAYRALRHEGQVTVALAETTALAVTIVRGYYWVGALGCCCYYVGQWLCTTEDAIPASPGHAPSPTWAWVQQAKEVCALPLTHVHKGDTIIVHAGEMVPVGGVVIAGIAWVKAANQPAQASLALDKRQAGCSVEPASIVQVGCLWITVV